jgi:ribosome-binding factor A
MSKNRRIYRVGEQIQSVVATQLLRMSDPRFNLVTISRVVPSSDLRVAKVYWLVTGGKDRVAEVDIAFDSAQGFLRSVVSKDLKMRVSPELRFYYDDTLDKQAEVFSLLEKVYADKQIDKASSGD